MVVNKLRKVGGLIKRAKEEIGETGSCYAGEFITLGIDKSDYFAPGGGFWYTEIGKWLDNITKGTIFDGGSSAEPYVAGLMAAGLYGLGSYLALKNGKYAMIADELERKLDNKEITVDDVLKEYGNDERALRKIAKYTSYEDEIMKRYKEMKEKEFEKIDSDNEKLNYIWDDYNRKVKWWEVLVPFYNFYGLIKEYKAEKELYKKIAEKVKSGKISYDAVVNRFGKRKADRIMRKYGKEEARKGERAGIFSRIKKGISGMWGGISEGLKGYFIKSAEDSSTSESATSKEGRTQSGIKKREGLFSRIKKGFSGVRSGIGDRLRSYFVRVPERFKKSRESIDISGYEPSIDTSEYYDLTEEKL